MLRNSLKLATILLPLTLLLLVSISLVSAKGTYVTTSDNENNAYQGVPDGDLGTYLCDGSLLLPIEFNIHVAESWFTSAHLLIYAWDVDDDTGETHNVYLNDDHIGALGGVSGAWSTSVFEVPTSLIVPDNGNRVKIAVSPVSCIQVNWGQILIDGGEAENADLLDLTIDNYTHTMGTVNVQTNALVSVTVTGTYHIEVLLIDPSQNTLDPTDGDNVDAFSASPGEFTRPITLTYDLDESSGTYQVIAILFDDATGRAQAIRRTAFRHVFSVGPVQFDFGDAPDPAYPTLLERGGARHTVVDGFYLGAGVDDEINAEPNATATGDDDEDGVTFTSDLRQGATANVDVVASDSGYLNAWMDFNADGDWADSGEHILTRIPLVTGTNSLSFLVPGKAVTGTTFARFRFNSTGALAYAGPANDGEVEDYQVYIQNMHLALTKTAQDLNGPPLFVDDLIRYTITVTNASEGLRTNVVVTDTLPEGVTFVLASGNYTGPNPLVWEVRNMAPGAVWTADIIVRVDGTADPIGGNVAAVSSDQQDVQETDPVFPPGNGDSADVVDGLTLGKTAQDLNGAPLYVGDEVRYTITVTNQYSDTMSGVLVTDTLPAGMAFVAARPEGYAGPNPLVWDVGELGPGVTWTAIISVVVDGTTTPISGNVAIVSSDQQNDQVSDSALPGDGAVELNPGALALAKTAQDLSGAPLLPGDEILYTIYLTNSLTMAQTGVVITDLIPNGLTYVPGSASASQGSISGPNPLVVNVGTLAAGQLVTLTFRATVDAGAVGQEIENFAQADSDQQEPSVEIGPVVPPGGGTVESMAEALDLAKTTEDLNGAPLYPGDEVLYTIYLTNSLSVEQTSVVITDAIPSGTTYVPGSAMSSQGTISGPDPLVVHVGTLAARQVVTFTFRVLVNADALGQTIQNYAQADSDQQDPPLEVGPVEPPGGGTVGLNPGALEFVKTAQDLDGPPIFPGDEILYTLVVTNLLAVEQTGVVITDAIPDGAVYVPGSALSSQGTISGPDPLVAHIGTLAAGQAVTFTFHVTVEVGAVGRVIKNYAQADSDQQDPPLAVGPIMPPSPVESLEPTADLAVSKSFIRTGESITYTIVARNLGPHNAPGAVVHDDVPTLIQNVSWTRVVSGNATCALGGLGNTLHITLTRFSAGAAITFTVWGNLGLLDEETNIVTIAAPEGIPDPDETNNIAMVGYPYKILMPWINAD
jgi:uncharacterized repeat protein (TIGR01451 family)